MIGVLILSQGVRYWVVMTLGRRWTTRVLVVPGDTRIETGPYRFLNHPNYVAVVAEGMALPLIYSNWITAAIFSAANAVLLATRVRIENKALRRLSSSVTSRSLAPTKSETIDLSLVASKGEEGPSTIDHRLSTNND